MKTRMNKDSEIKNWFDATFYTEHLTAGLRGEAGVPHHDLGGLWTNLSDESKAKVLKHMRVRKLITSEVDQGK